MPKTMTRVLPVLLALSFAGLTFTHADRKGKHKSNRYHGGHPLSVKPEAGFCYIEVPHVHAHSIHKKHKPLYREHQGHLVFVADPVAYGYEGPQHTYYGHHPIAVDVVLGHEASYASGQQLEFCYLEGPHYHPFDPQPGLSFEASAGASWYVGDLPSAYVDGKARFSPVNRVYANIEVARPEIVVEAPPVGYHGPVMDIHLHVPGAVVVDPGHVDVEVGGRGHKLHHGRGHVDVRTGVEIHVPVPSIQVEFGVNAHGHSHKGKKHKHKGKHKGKHKRKGRKPLRW